MEECFTQPNLVDTLGISYGLGGPTATSHAMLPSSRFALQQSWLFLVAPLLLGRWSAYIWIAGGGGIVYESSEGVVSLSAAELRGAREPVGSTLVLACSTSRACQN